MNEPADTEQARDQVPQDPAGSGMQGKVAYRSRFIMQVLGNVVVSRGT